MIEEDRLIQATVSRDDEAVDRAIRPKTLADYTDKIQSGANVDFYRGGAKARRCA